MTAGTDAVEDGGHRLQVAEIDVECAQRGHDDEVRQDEGPAAGPGAPEAAAQVGDVDADLNRERSGQRLADRDRLAHLLLGEPFAVVDQFAFHLADQRNRAAEAETAEPQEVAHQFADPAFWNDCRRRHFQAPPACCERTVGRRLASLSRSSPTARTSRVKPEGSALRARRLVECGAQSLGQLQGVVVGPEMQEEQPRLLVQHVTVDRRDVDAVRSQRLDHRIYFVVGEDEIAGDGGLAAAGRLKVDADGSTQRRRRSHGHAVHVHRDRGAAR